MSNKLLKYFNGDELAASVWKQKYALEKEETPDDMHHRMAKEFAKIEEKYQKEEDKFNDNSKTPYYPLLSDYAYKRKYLTEKSIYNLFKDFKYVIPQGSIMSQLGADSIGSLSNCFVVGQPKDSYGGIFQKDQELAQLMKRRGGVGIDISTLRPSGVATSNAAKSSTGAVSFMNRFSNTTREVAQNGRRGALMISMDINHPDIMEFIIMKRDLSKITGANISIKLNDDFMKAVEADEDYILRFPCDLNVNIAYPDPKQLEYDVLLKLNSDVKEKEGYIKKIKAKEYWNEIIKSAHNVAEPGLMFWNRMVEYSPDGVYPQFKQVTTNPCSEIAMQPYDACRLIAVNLFSFVKNPFTKQASFDYDKFYEINYEAMRISDDLIDLEINHIDRILEKLELDIIGDLLTGDDEIEVRQMYSTEVKLWKKVKETALASRRTGLGFTALGDTLAALGLKYDSDAAIGTIESISTVKMRSELDCTIDLAILRGTFKGWDPDIENNSFYDFLADNFPKQSHRMNLYGRRNVSFSTVAPTGSLSMLAQVTSGIEPLFLPFYKRRKKVNPNDKNVRVDFTDDNGDTWQEYFVLHEKFKDWLQVYFEENSIDGDIDYNNEDELQSYFEISPWYKSTANDIDWVKRVRVQATIQKYITHSISSTINLPEDVSEESVSEIYLESWKQGVKGITVYRDGSRSGVLVSTTEKDNNKFDYKDAVKRPKELKAETYYSTTKGVGYHIIIGLLDGKPYEVFMDDTDNRYSEKGVVIKEARGKYVFKNGGDPIQIKDFMTPEQQAITRLVSMGLRHGTAIKFVVEQLQKIDGDMFSFARSLARVLKKFIPDGEKVTGVTCNDCGSNNIRFEEGCSKCLDCGSSKCN